MKYINYMDYLSISESFFTNQAYHKYRVLYRLFKLIGRYLNSSITQYNRIEEWAVKQRNLGSRKVYHKDLAEIEQVFSDLHFLLIAMDKCYKYIAALYSLLNDEINLKLIHQSKQAFAVRNMRNTIEHSEENIQNDTKNLMYNLPEEFLPYGWSWLEYQLLSIKEGKFVLKDKTLKIDTTMFNEIIGHLHNISSHLQNLFNNIEEKEHL